MNALRWVILLAVVAVAGLLVYLATSNPAQRVDPDRSERPPIAPDRKPAPDQRRAEEAAGTVYRATLRVLLPGGEAATHAGIEVRGPVAESVEAGKDGAAAIDGLLPGRYDLVAGSGRATGALQFEITDADVDLGTLRLVAGVIIRGTVFGSKGEPIAGALVESVSAANTQRSLDMTVLLQRMVLPDRVISHAGTGSDGVYTLTVPRGQPVQLRASVGGHAQEGYPTRSFGSDVEGLDFHLMTGAPIAGRIMGPGGEPVVGAQVLVVDPMSMFGGGLPKCETRSDSAGRFEFTPAPAEQLMLLVHATGFAMYTNQSLRPPVLDLAIELERGFAVRLRTVDQDDPSRPAPHVDVTVVYGGGLQIGRTDERGEMLLSHVSAAETGAFGGAEMALFWGGGFVPHKLDLSDREPVNGLLDLGDVALDPGGVVRGRVTDAESGDPIEGALVRSVGGLDQELMTVGGVPAATDADGRYELHGVPLGAAAVIAIHNRYHFDPQVVMRTFGMRQGGNSLFEPGKRQAERDLTLTRALVLRGKVVAPDGRPVSGARVSAGDSQGMMISMFLGGAPPVVFTDANGAFEIIPPPALTVTSRISATHRDFGPSEPMPMPVPKSDEGEILLRLQPPHVVRGQVVDAEGEPIAAVRVRAAVKAKNAGDVDAEVFVESMAGQSTTTDEEGGFKLRNAPSGEVVLHFEHPDYVPGELEIFVDRKTGSTDAPAFALKLGESITGIVVDPEGKPAPGVQVFANYSGNWDESATGRTWGSTTTDQEGRFVLGGLRPGLFRVQVSLSGFYARESDVSTGPDEARLVLTKAIALKGRVLSRGAPVAGAWAQASMRLAPAEGERESWDYLDSKRTDAKGEFRMSELPPDRPLRITIRHDLYRNAEFDDVVPDGQEKTFHLQAGRQVSGIVVDERNRPMANVQVQITDGDETKSVQTAEDGSFAAGGLVSERIRLQTLESNRNLVTGEETEVVAGARNVRLVVTQGQLLEGRIHGLEAVSSEWASVEALDAEGNAVQTGYVNMGTGAFAIRGLRPGTYTLRVVTYVLTEGSDNTYEEQELGRFAGIAAGSSGVELTLAR